MVWSYRHILGENDVFDNGCNLTWDRYEKILLDMDEESWTSLLRRERRSTSGPITTGDEWFDDLERQLWEDEDE